jgi:hypothetical protein
MELAKPFPEKGWNVVLRLYEPGQSWCDKTRRSWGIEPVE